MATQPRQKEMMASFKRARADIASMTDWLECELDAKYNDENAATWSAVGSLQYVRKNFLETLAFLSGFEESEIQRSLDELHS